MKTNFAAAITLYLCVGFPPTDAFQISHPQGERASISLLYLSGRPDWLRKASGVKRTTEETKKMADSLQRREESLHMVGQRLVCRQPELPVYLFVPDCEHDLQDESNIVYRLEEGEEVTVSGPHRGNWIDHDGGGWSTLVSPKGETCLEPIP